MKKFLFVTLSIGIGLFIPIVAAEVVLQFLPVMDSFRVQSLNAANPVRRFAPNRSVTYSKGWNFSMVNEVRINNEGFVNDQDYSPNDPGPLLAVIGDSFVEALMVPFMETMHGRLADLVSGAGRVYSFAGSAAGPPTYLNWAAHARDTYQPDGMVFVIVDSDFTEVYLRDKRTTGLYYFRDDGRKLELVRVDYEPSILRKLVRRSALGMYLAVNVKIQNVPAVLRRLLWGKAGTSFVGNTTSIFNDNYERDARRAVDAYLDRAPSAAGLAPSRILMILDGLRPGLYDKASLEQAEAGFIGRIRRYFLTKAIARGFEVIDMQEEFLRVYARDGHRFEYHNDPHWNGRGHAVAYAVVARSRVFSQVFGDLGSSRVR